MKMRALSLAILIALSAAPTAFAQEAPPPLPTLDLSTMLFQMLTEGSDYANTLDPFDVNGINIDFGDDDSDSGALLDDMLQGK